MLSIDNNRYDEFIVVAPGSDYGMNMWYDVSAVQNARLLSAAVDSGNLIIDTLHHIHFSFLLNKRLDLPFQRIWRRKYSVESIHLDPGKKYCIVYTDISACRTDLDYLDDLHHKSNVTMVLFMVNEVKKKKRLVLSRLYCFNYVFSSFHNDVDAYGLRYYPTVLSKLPVPGEINRTFDAFFVGNSNGRRQIVMSIASFFDKHSIDYEFFLKGVPRAEQVNKKIHYNHSLPYSKVLEYDKAANCVVEVIAANNMNLTLRVMEAIIYNKKLLTNNGVVKELPYFKSGYISLFNNVEDIDVKFVKDRAQVNYHYQGEYSPIKFLEHLTSL